MRGDDRIPYRRVGDGGEDPRVPTLARPADGMGAAGFEPASSGL
jgi:hypothetical protein